MGYTIRLSEDADVARAAVNRLNELCRSTAASWRSALERTGSFVHGPLDPSNAAQLVHHLLKDGELFYFPDTTTKDLAVMTRRLCAALRFVAEAILHCPGFGGRDAEWSTLSITFRRKYLQGKRCFNSKSMAHALFVATTWAAHAPNATGKHEHFHTLVGDDPECSPDRNRRSIVADVCVALQGLCELVLIDLGCKNSLAQGADGAEADDAGATAAVNTEFMINLLLCLLKIADRGGENEALLSYVVSRLWHRSTARGGAGAAECQ
jgi:hypothetical protein